MDGYALAGELRTRLADPPVLIALSGYSQAKDLARSEAAGFAVHLVKPIDAGDLVDVIVRYSGTASAR
jgi:CheY-like chemotaxis protein